MLRVLVGQLDATARCKEGVFEYAVVLDILHAFPDVNSVFKFRVHD